MGRDNVGAPHFYLADTKKSWLPLVMAAGERFYAS
jgi:hypothetical protein